MRELFLDMLFPEYTITSKILKNIASVEYSKAIIENTTILPTWEKQLVKEANIKTAAAMMKMLGFNIIDETVKKAVDNLKAPASEELSNIVTVVNETSENNVFDEIDENELKEIHKKLTNNIKRSKSVGYRERKVKNKVAPDEILAYLVQLFDWYSSLDAAETHPIIKSAILKAYLHIIEPLESYNEPSIDIIIWKCLKGDNYNLKDFISLSDCNIRSRYSYEHLLNSFDPKDPDFTGWIEYFTEVFSIEATNIKAKVLLLAKDTKIARVTGRVRLSTRQERIIEYLQDYGILQNKDFPRIFPKISEDTVLRELKKLMDKNMVVKRGSTKNSRYELK